MSLVVITDKTLRATGLDFDTAKALLAPDEGTLVVHVHQQLDGPPIPKPEPEAIEPQTTAGAISSLGMKFKALDTGAPMAPPESLDVYTPRSDCIPGGAGGHGGHTLRQTAPGESSISDAVPTIRPTNVEPGLDEAFTQGGRPHRLEPGCSLGEAAAVAQALRMTLTAGHGSGLLLSDSTGSTAHASLSSVLPILNARLAHLGAIGVRWPTV